MPSPPGFLRLAYFKWKSLKLPWRKRWLVGADLTGNTFWEFKDALNAQRLRRIVQYSHAAHYADVQISPQWHQWLRHTRPAPPSLEEQRADVARRAQMRELAARADERWESLGSVLDRPGGREGKAGPALGVSDSADVGRVEGEGEVRREIPEAAGGGGVKSAVGDKSEVAASSSGGEAEDEGSTAKKARKTKDKDANPWKQPDRGIPGENWQPQTWSPGVSRRG